MIHGTKLFGLSNLDFIHHIVNNSMVFLFFMEYFLGTGLLPQSLVGWAASYLFMNLSKTLHSSE